MDGIKVGKAIAYLRKRAGYTQKDLADRIGISDKAVSKWERGLGLPEIGCLRKLSILLDTDTDSLLAGDVVHHDESWVGIIVLDKNDYGIGAETIIYDKPLITFLLSYFLLVGIRHIIVIGSDNDKRFIDEKFGPGELYGIELSIYTSALELETIDSICHRFGNVMMVYGRCLLYGVDQTRFFQKAMVDKNRFTMLVLPQKLGESTSRVVIDSNKKVINSEEDEPLRTQYDFSDIPFLFFPSNQLKELICYKDIGNYVSEYISKHDVYVQMLDRGFVEIEIDNLDDVQEAAAFIKIVQNRCGMNVYCLEEVAWRRGMISLDRLKELGEKQQKTEYGQYILKLHNRITNSQNN